MQIDKIISILVIVGISIAILLGFMVVGVPKFEKDARFFHHERFNHTTPNPHQVTT